MVITNGKHRITGLQERITVTDNPNFDKIIIEGTGWISFPAVKWLTYLGVNVIMLDRKGDLYGNFNQVKGDYTPLIRQKQFDCFRDKKCLEYLRKWLITQRISSQISLFKQLAGKNDLYVNAISRMEKQFDRLNHAHTLRQIMQIESNVAMSYYPTFSRVVNPKFGFHSRKDMRTGVPKDATDVINALLNYGFSILHAEVSKLLNGIGFDCNIGFYHKSHPNQVPLVYDMMEAFRYLVERAVFEISDTIQENEYAFVNYDTKYPYSRIEVPLRWLYLSSNLKKRYSVVLASVFARKRPYKAQTGLTDEHGNQNMEEITIMKMKCNELRDYVLGRKRTSSEPTRILNR